MEVQMNLEYLKVLESNCELPPDTVKLTPDKDYTGCYIAPSTNCYIAATTPAPTATNCYIAETTPAPTATTSPKAPLAYGDTPAATPPPTAMLSAAEKAVSPRVVSKMTLAEKVNADQQTSVRSGYATAAGVPIENVEIAQDTRRAVSYSVTVFVKDSAAATAVMTKLSDTAALKSALKAAVPHPRTIVCVLCVCLSVCVLGHTD